MEFYTLIDVEALGFSRYGCGLQLKGINKEKEKYYSEKESLKKQIFSIIDEIKKIKSEKDKSNINVREIRDKREYHNSQVRDLIEKIKKINEKKRELLKKDDLKGDPSKIKEEMEDHLLAINENTNEISSQYEYICELENKVEEVKKRNSTI